jgi:membrane protein
LTFFALIILGPLLFGASISITGTILHSKVWTRLSIPGLGPALSLLVPLMLTWAGFLLLYVVIPSAPLRLRPALLASLTVAATWEFVKIGFEWYVANVASYGKLYASLSVIPVFLLWLYVGWVIALLGFEVAFFLQHPEACRGPVTLRAASATVPARDAIRTFVAVAEAFVKGGKPLTAVQVAQQVPLRDDVATASLAELERQGYVARVASPPDAYLPRRAPATVKVADLWHDLGGGMALSDGDMLDRLLAEAARSTARTLGHTTVQDLLDAGPGSAMKAIGGPAREDITELA